MWHHVVALDRARAIMIVSPAGLVAAAFSLNLTSIELVKIAIGSGRRRIFTAHMLSVIDGVILWTTRAKAPNSLEQEILARGVCTIYKSRLSCMAPCVKGPRKHGHRWTAYLKNAFHHRNELLSAVK